MVCNGLDPPDLTSVFSNCPVTGEFSATSHVQNCLLGPQRRFLEIAAHTVLCCKVGIEVCKVKVKVATLEQRCDDRLKYARLVNTEAIFVQRINYFADTRAGVVEDPGIVGASLDLDLRCFKPEDINVLIPDLLTDFDVSPVQRAHR